MTNLLGTAVITRAVYERRDLSPLFSELRRRAAAYPPDPAAKLDLATLFEISGRRKQSVSLRTDALAMRRIYETINGSGDGLRVLQIKTTGNLMANTPTEFLLEGTNTRLFSLYVDAGMEQIPQLPPHDVAILAVGESEAHKSILTLLQSWQKNWPRPVFNNEPQRILGLARERLAGAFSGSLHAFVPKTFEAEGAMLRALANGQEPIAEVFPGLAFPIVVRPFGAHAGQGTQKIDAAVQLTAYLNNTASNRFSVTPFFDYASSDGYFRKQRIAFIMGQPYACHMAISRHWMVHYLNAEMETQADRRMQEAAWMKCFDSTFAIRHALAFEEVVQRIDLDYFAIDCGELPDGRLIVFEADTAMIVHDMDSPEVFPYKKPAMRKLFNAFEDALRHCSAREGRNIPVEPGPALASGSGA